MKIQVRLTHLTNNPASPPCESVSVPICSRERNLYWADYCSFAHKSLAHSLPQSAWQSVARRIQSIPKKFRGESPLVTACN
jgi:hypothetical protein